MTDIVYQPVVDLATGSTRGGLLVGEDGGAMAAAVVRDPRRPAGTSWLRVPDDTAQRARAVERLARRPPGDGGRALLGVLLPIDDDPEWCADAAGRLRAAGLRIAVEGTVTLDRLRRLAADEVWIAPAMVAAVTVDRDAAALVLALASLAAANDLVCVARGVPDAATWAAVIDLRIPRATWGCGG